MTVKFLKSRIKFCIGLVCGHLKSAHFASMWSWQTGIHPNDLRAIDFRAKLDGYKANHYAVNVTGNVEGNLVSKTSAPLNSLYGGDWGWGLFKYNACDYCDDVVSETADVTIGDAWLPEYVHDSQGTNIIIIRSNFISHLIKEAQNNHKLNLEPLSASRVIASQASGFSHRRDGLAYRLHITQINKKWHPNKRVKAADTLPSKLRKRHLLRIELAATSHKAFQDALKKNSFQVFIHRLAPIIQQYNKTYKTSYVRAILRKLICFKKLLVGRRSV